MTLYYNNIMMNRNNDASLFSKIKDEYKETV